MKTITLIIAVALCFACSKDDDNTNESGVCEGLYHNIETGDDMHQQTDQPVPTGYTFVRCLSAPEY